MSRFLITGLPRSRTAWFAVATGARHEPISRLGWRKYKPMWADGTGVSDAGAALYLKEILAEYVPRTLIIERDIGEVLTSFLRYTNGLAIDKAALSRRLWSAKRYLAQIDSPLVKRVAFDALDDFDTMAECMDWLGVSVPNLADLMHFNIQSSLVWNLAQLRKMEA